MPRYIERDTELEVDVTSYASYLGEPIGALVTMPNGARFSLPMDSIPKYFDLVTPQEVVLELLPAEFNRTKGGV